MKRLLQLEELILLLLSVVLFAQLNFPWWWYPALLFVPDVCMLGYLVNAQIGSVAYNVLHNRILAGVVAIIGLWIAEPLWQLAGLILFAHISFDRMLAIGLKRKGSFIYTHLGEITWINKKWAAYVNMDK